MRPHQSELVATTTQPGIGLPPFLAHEPGLMSGMMLSQYTADHLIVIGRGRLIADMGTACMSPPERGKGDTASFGGPAAEAGDFEGKDWATGRVLGVLRVLGREGGQGRCLLA